jgi:hypothetical protein
MPATGSSGRLPRDGVLEPHYLLDIRSQIFGGEAMRRWGLAVRVLVAAASFVSFASVSAVLKGPFAGMSLPVAAASVGGVPDPTLVESFGDAPAVPPNVLVGAAAIAPNARTGYVVRPRPAGRSPGPLTTCSPRSSRRVRFLSGHRLAPSPSPRHPMGKGNWLAGADGGVFTFGTLVSSARRVVCG